MIRRLLLLALLALPVTLYACADLPDDSSDAAELDAAPELEKSTQALVIAGYPQSLKVNFMAIGGTSGWSSSGAIVMNKNGGVVWGTQGYIACPSCFFEAYQVVNAVSCTTDPTGGWFCDGRSVKCPKAKPYVSPDFYAMAGGSYLLYSANNGPQSWWTAANGFEQNMAVMGQFTLQPYVYKLVCGYGAGVQSYALGHY